MIGFIVRPHKVRYKVRHINDTLDIYREVQIKQGHTAFPGYLEKRRLLAHIKARDVVLSLAYRWN